MLRNDEHTTLTVDGVSQSKASRGKEFQFGKFSTNSDIFVGGMPNWYNAKLALLALPSVIFEPRFRGSVRNIVYMDQPGVLPRRQEMRQPRDVKVNMQMSQKHHNQLSFDRVTIDVVEADSTLELFRKFNLEPTLSEAAEVKVAKPSLAFCLSVVFKTNKTALWQI